MAGPAISIYDSTHTSLVSTWNVGVVKAQTPSKVLTVNIREKRHVGDLMLKLKSP